MLNFHTQPGTAAPAAGCVGVDRELATQSLRDPERFYFNLHIAEFPWRRNSRATVQLGALSASVHSSAATPRD